MNKLGVVLLIAFGAVSLTAKSDDVIPLGKKTAPKPGGDEAQIMAPRTNNPGASAPAGAGAESNSSTAAPNWAGQGKVSGLQTPPPPPEPYIASFETFGSGKINERVIKELLGEEFNTWITKGLKGDPSASELEARLLDKIKKKYNFALAEWSIVQYFEPGDMAIHLTLDVVEAADVAVRMPFRAAPTADLPDPGGLLKTWVEYETIALDLTERAEIDPDAGKCAALHCPFGHKHVKLKKYEKIFLDGARKNEAALAKILKESGNDDYRASSAYLLAYLKDGKKVVDYLSDAIKDPDDLVRNNVLRVLGDIAEHHPEYVIPLKPLQAAIDFPRVSDRSKALYALYHLVSNSRPARDEVLKSNVIELLRLLESKQPDHRDLAHGILRKISGKDFTVTDVRAWNDWYNRLDGGKRSLSKKP